MKKLAHRTPHKTVLRLSQQLKIPNYWNKTKAQLLQAIHNRINTDPDAMKLVTSQLSVYDATDPRTMAHPNYNPKRDPNYTRNYQYEYLSPTHLNHLKSLVKVTSKRCKDPGKEVLQRQEIVSFINSKLPEKDYITVKILNGAISILYNRFGNIKLTIDAVTGNLFLLNHKPTFIIIDLLITSPSLRVEAAEMYEKRSKKGRHAKLGKAYFEEYVKHSKAKSVGDFFHYIGFKNHPFFFKRYLTLCKQHNILEAYINLCALWDSYLKDQPYDPYRLDRNAYYASKYF